MVVVLALTLGACASNNGTGTSGDTPGPHPRNASLVEAKVKISPQPNYVMGAFGSLWVTTGDGKIGRIDPATNQVTTMVAVGGRPGPILPAFGDLWVADSYAGRVMRIDPHSNKVIDRIKVPGGAYGMAIGFGSVWVTGQTWHGFVKIDPGSNKVVARRHADGNDIAVGYGSLWVTGPNQGVIRLSPRDFSVQARVKTSLHLHSLAVGAGAVWGASGDSGDRVFRIDPAHNKLAAAFAADPASFPDRVSFSKGLVWVGEFQAGKVLGIDPQSNKVVHHLDADLGSAVITVAFGSLWVDNYYANSVWRFSLDRID